MKRKRRIKLGPFTGYMVQLKRQIVGPLGPQVPINILPLDAYAINTKPTGRQSNQVKRQSFPLRGSIPLVCASNPTCLSWFASRGHRLVVLWRTCGCTALSDFGYMSEQINNN